MISYYQFSGEWPVEVEGGVHDTMTLVDKRCGKALTWCYAPIEAYGSELPNYSAVGPSGIDVMVGPRKPDTQLRGRVTAAQLAEELG